MIVNTMPCQIKTMLLWQCTNVAWLFCGLAYIARLTADGTEIQKWGYFSDGPGLPKLVRFSAGFVQGDKEAKKRGTVFQLYTRKNPDFGEVIQVGRLKKLMESNYNVSLPTKIVVHGFLASINNPHIVNIKTAYLVASDLNVIMVDWHLLAASSYFNAVANAGTVGQHVASLVKFLVRNADVGLDAFHIVGHSLGAHVAGFAGAELRASGIIMPRITGLDPASPLFHDKPIESRLDPTDAAFVDVIHTCGSDFGMLQPAGHVDFYPNGGVDPQPGCEVYIDIAFAQESCSHRRAVELYSESLTTAIGFPSMKCESWLKYLREECNATESIVYMGDSKGKHNIDIGARGVYYLKTSPEYPYTQLTWKKHFWV